MAVPPILKPYEPIKSRLSLDLANSLFYYDEPTGRLIRKSSRNHDNARIGLEAGTIGKRGYRVISVGGKFYYAHRIVWLMHTERWPLSKIDHIDHNKLNNRFLNLREVSDLESSRNQGMSKNNTSGVNGVVWHKGANKWMARIHDNGKGIYLGLFDNLDEAYARRKAAELELGYHPTHGEQ